MRCWENNMDASGSSSREIAKNNRLEYTVEKRQGYEGFPKISEPTQKQGALPFTFFFTVITSLDIYQTGYGRNE